MNKKNLVFYLIAFSIVFLDQLTKYLIKRNLSIDQTIPIIRNRIHITYVANTGSAFGFFKGFNLLFILFSILVIFVIFHYLKDVQKKEVLTLFSLGLLFGGTVGNLIDRIFRGAVTDFVDFRIWPVFNLADSAITISVIILVIILWKK